MANLWYGVTQDSFVVDVRDVTSPGGIAAYLAKYLSKSFMTGRYELLEKGYKRRYQRSANWPGGEKMQFKATLEENWVAQEFHSNPIEMPGVLVDGTPAARRVGVLGRIGTEMAEKYVRRSRIRKAKSNVSSKTDDVAEDGNPKYG